MSSKKKIQSTDEIDLIELVVIVWSNKWKIFFTIALSFTIMFAYISSKPTKKILYEAKTEIRPISTFDESRYESYNSYLANTYIENILYPIKSNRDKNLNLNEIDKSFIYKNIDSSSFYKIDKVYLLKLFIDKLNENLILINAIKNSELIKKEDYEDEETYENEITKLSSLISISAVKDNITKEVFYQIKYQTYDKKIWKNFILYVEKNTNEEIRNYLIKKFEQLLVDEERLRKYRIEDLNLKISNTLDDEELKYLKREMTILKLNTKIRRIKDLFESTPVMKPEDFYAGKMMALKTKYKSNLVEETSEKTMYLLSITIGFILGIFYVLILNSVKNRKIEFLKKI